MNRLPQILLVVLSLVFLTSCELVGDIFNAGFWTGVIVVVGFIVLLFWLVSKARGGRKNP